MMKAGMRHALIVGASLLGLFGDPFITGARALNDASDATAPAQSADVARQVSLPVSQAGVFDPSLADTGLVGRAWMSYSAVDPSPRWSDKNTRTVTTRLAYSDDHGATWTDLGRVNDIKEFSRGAKGATWINEVSSLVFDPGAAPAERWQLYWHHYMSIGDNGQFSNGWIGYKGAATPEGLITAKEVKLFGGRVYEKANNDSASETSPPVGGPPVIQLDTLHSDLAYCLALTEPGAMATSTGVYMAMVCVQPRVHNILGMLGIGLFGTRGSTILLRCDAPCHPASPTAWRYISTLLTDDDAKAFGSIGFAAPDLFMQSGQSYLLISPTSNDPVNGSYNGCFVTRFVDLDRGIISRTPSGQFAKLKTIQGHQNTFNGACTYQPSVSASGFVYGEIKFGDKPFFQIFQTGGSKERGNVAF
jgi:hypothetical protein